MCTVHTLEFRGKCQLSVFFSSSWEFGPCHQDIMHFFHFIHAIKHIIYHKKTPFFGAKDCEKDCYPLPSLSKFPSLTSNNSEDNPKERHNKQIIFCQIDCKGRGGPLLSAFRKLSVRVCPWRRLKTEKKRIFSDTGVSICTMCALCSGWGGQQ